VTGATPVPTALRWGLHALVGALLALVALRSVFGGADDWPQVVACAALVGALYAFGPRWVAAAPSPRRVGVWLAVLLVAWCALLVLSPEAVYLAFAWFLLLLHLLPRPLGLAAVALTTAASIAGFAWHQDTFTAAMVIGPVLGAGVAIATVYGYHALQAESEQRRRLIVELDRTRAELAAEQHRTGVLDERERLAREIHDTLAQGLSSIQLLLRAAGRALDPAHQVAGMTRADTTRAGVLVEQARQTAQENLAEARRLVRELAPRDLEGSTLAAALQRLCDTTSSRSGIHVAFHDEGGRAPLSTSMEVALLRIAQTALANTVQHSRATRADVTLTVMDHAVTLDVLDDGTGFDAGSALAGSARVSAEPGFGLRSMQSRAAELGGVLTVESEPGQGTAVSVQFARSAPMPPADGVRDEADVPEVPDEPDEADVPAPATVEPTR
jgi:signal transduction histidine kinase